MKKYLSILFVLLLAGCGTLQKKKGMSLEEVRRHSRESLDAAVSAMDANTDPQLTDGFYWVDDIDGTPLSNKILWGTLLNDTKGNGDIAHVWSADKIYDELAGKQDYHLNHDYFAALTPAENKLPYFDSGSSMALADLTPFARSILDDSDEATFKATVNLEIGTDVLAPDGDGASLTNVLHNLSEDLTPQLGGDLNLATHGIDFPTTPNITDVLDEDTMASNSATKLATQQSIKAYADTKENDTHASEHAPNGADPVSTWYWGGALTVGDATPPVTAGYLYDCTGGTTITITDFYDSGDDDDGDFTDGDRFGVLMNDPDVEIDFSENANIEGNADVDFAGNASQVILIVFQTRNGVWYANLTTGFSDALTYNRGALQLPYSTSGDATLTEAYVQQKSDEDGVAYHGGSTGKVQGEVFNSWIDQIEICFDPTLLCDGTIDAIKLFNVDNRYPHGFTVTEWEVSFESDPTTEFSASQVHLAYADAWLGLANATDMDDLATTAGVSSETTKSNINSGNPVANGKIIYLKCDSSYSESDHRVCFKLEGYGEED